MMSRNFRITLVMSELLSICLKIGLSNGNFPSLRCIYLLQVLSVCFSFIECGLSKVFFHCSLLMNYICLPRIFCLLFRLSTVGLLQTGFTVKAETLYLFVGTHAFRSPKKRFHCVLNLNN